MEKIKDTYMLIFKFGEKENLEKLKKGSLYFRNTEYFNKCEEDDGDTKRGDKVDDKWTYKKDGKVILLGKSKSATITDKEVNQMPIFCFSSIKLSDVINEGQVVSENEDNIIYNIKLKDFFKDVFKEDYWNHVLIIKDAAKFIDKIKNECKSRNIGLRGNSINYYNHSNLYERMNDIKDESANALFWKHESYKGQRESRFVLSNQAINKDEPYFLEIGDISNYCEIIKREELAEMDLKFVLYIK